MFVISSWREGGTCTDCSFRFREIFPPAPLPDDKCHTAEIGPSDLMTSLGERGHGAKMKQDCFFCTLSVCCVLFSEGIFHYARDLFHKEGL